MRGCWEGAVEGHSVVVTEALLTALVVFGLLGLLLASCFVLVQLETCFYGDCQEAESSVASSWWG